MGWLKGRGGGRSWRIGGRCDGWRTRGCVAGGGRGVVGVGEQVVGEQEGET